jgi:uncharacterized protein (TIGR03118 family)
MSKTLSPGIHRTARNASMTLIPSDQVITLRVILFALAISLICLATGAAVHAETPKGYLQTNLISNGVVDAKVIDKNFIDPWGVSIGTDFWINANVTGLDYVTSSTGAIAFTVTIPPASGSGTGSPTGTVFTGSAPAGSFLLPDKTAPFFLFCTLDGTVSGWSGGSVQISLNNSKANAIYNDMALLTNSKGTYLLLANFGAGADVEVYDTHYKKAMAGAFVDPDVPATYAPYAVHVINGSVYVDYTPRTVPGYQEIFGAGHGFVDQFDENGKFISRIIPVGGKLDAPWGMALAPATFGAFGGDLLVGSFGSGTISAYDPKTFKYEGQISDANGNVIANPGLWEIVFGQVSPAVGDPNTLYFTAGLKDETAGLFGTITAAPTTATATKTSIVSDLNPATKGAPVSFTALVQPSTGTGEPEGKVAFTLDGVKWTTATVDSTAHASVTTSTLALGKHVIKATYSGDTNFATSSASITETVNPPTAAAPVFSPAAGSYTAAKSITITDATKGAAIYYTIDGTTPTAKSSLYAKSFTVAKTTTVKAIAIAAGFANSTVSSATYTIGALKPAATPTFSPAGGTFTSAQTVSILDATKGAVIWYTVDGTTPTLKSPVYSKPIAVSKTTTIKAFASATGFADSPVASATYTINTSNTAATPTYSPAGGTFTSTQTVSILDATKGAEIWYTVDGSTPTFSSPIYSKPITVSKTTTIKAFASASGMADSPVSSATYTISAASATAVPAFSPAPGTFTSTQYVYLTDATSGAKIYYTTDGTTPTTNSRLYSSAITVASTATIKAMAIAPGWTGSSVSTATFTISSGGGSW